MAVAGHPLLLLLHCGCAELHYHCRYHCQHHWGVRHQAKLA
jgi:hypothetical protein